MTLRRTYEAKAVEARAGRRHRICRIFAKEESCATVSRQTRKLFRGAIYQQCRVWIETEEGRGVVWCPKRLWSACSRRDNTPQQQRRLYPKISHSSGGIESRSDDTEWHQDGRLVSVMKTKRRPVVQEPCGYTSGTLLWVSMGITETIDRQLA